MSYRDKIAHNPDHIFSNDELSSVTVTDVNRWNTVRAYDVPYHGPEAHPLQKCGSSLCVAKKSISLFVHIHLPPLYPGLHS
jgi:hypothetical protein